MQSNALELTRLLKYQRIFLVSMILMTFIFYFLSVLS